MPKRGRLKLSEIKVAQYKHQKLNSDPFPNTSHTSTPIPPIDDTLENSVNSVTTDIAIQTNSDHKISIDSQTHTSIELINRFAEENDEPLFLENLSLAIQNKKLNHGNIPFLLFAEMLRFSLSTDKCNTPSCISHHEHIEYYMQIV